MMYKLYTLCTWNYQIFDEKCLPFFREIFFIWKTHFFVLGKSK